jgi:hypothetical protein
MESSTAKTKPKKTTDDEFFKEAEILSKENPTNIKEKFMELLEKYSANFHPVEMKRISLFGKISRLFEREEIKQIFYDTLFPFKDTYTAKEFIHELKRDVGKISSFNSNTYIKSRLNYYFEHISQELNNEQKTMIEESLKKETFNSLPANIVKKVQNLIESKELKNRRKTIVYPRNKEKLNAFPANTNIYRYGGHGTDMCNPNTHQPLEATVPEDCILITTGLCGRVTNFNKVEVDFFRESTEHSRKLLRYPYVKENLIELSKQLNIPVENFHIKLPGEKYIVSSFYPTAEWNSENTFMISESGLCEKRDMELLPDTVQTYNISKQMIPYLINYIKKDISGNIQTVDIPNRIQEYDFKPFQHWSSWRVNSLKAKLISPDRISFFTEIAEKKPVLSEEELKKSLEEYLYRISVKEFIDYFKASTFPTATQVKTVTNSYYKKKYKKDPTPDSILKGEDIKSITMNLQNSQGSNYTTKYLMETFPGIHYFTICRSVAANCEEGATLRRTSSEIENKGRREEIEKGLLSRYEFLSNQENKLGGTRKKRKGKRKTRKY